MIRKGLFLVCALLIPALLLAAKPSKSKGKNKKKAKTEQTDTASVKKTSDYDKLFKYKGENETYIEASAENGGSVLYDKEIRDKPRTRRTKRNV